LIFHDFLPLIVPPASTGLLGGTLSFSVWSGSSLCLP
jgi:hypothetical protein